MIPPVVSHRSLGSVPLQFETDSIGMCVAVHTDNTLGRFGLDWSLRGNEHRANISRSLADDLMRRHLHAFEPDVVATTCGARINLHVVSPGHSRVGLSTVLEQSSR